MTTTETANRFVSPCSPPEGYARELLTVLVEEAAEVQQRTTKALRFGIEEVQPGQDLSNAARLGREVGDFQEVLSRLIAAGIIPPASIEDGRANKRRQLDKFMQTAAPTPAPAATDVTETAKRIAHAYWLAMGAIDAKADPQRIWDAGTDQLRAAWLAAARAVSPAPALSGWRPIETAPRDRTDIIVAVPSVARGGHIVSAAYFDPKAYDGSWWWCGTSHSDYGASCIEDGNDGPPVAWQPLPPAPGAATTAQQPQPADALSGEVAWNALERVRDELGEAIHASLRKGTSSTAAGDAWRAIRNMPAKNWREVIDFALDGLGVTAALRSRQSGQSVQGGGRNNG